MTAQAAKSRCWTPPASAIETPYRCYNLRAW